MVKHGRFIGLALLCWFALTGADCSGFPPETLAERLRIIGIRAEPPTVGLADMTILEALAVDPAGEGRPVTYTWAVCLLELEETAMDLECPGPNTYPLPGHGPATTLSMPALVAWALEQDFPIDLGGDLPVEEVSEVPLLIGLRVDAGEDSTSAIKRIKLRLVADGPLNTNPTLSGLEVDGQPVTNPQTVRLGTAPLLRPLVTWNSQDWFVMEGETEERQEDHLFSWFSTTGEFSDQRTILDVSNDGRQLEVNEWVLPKDDQELGDHTLWLVVRDGRYGIDWMEFPFVIEP